MIKIHHAQELLEAFDCGGSGKLLDSVNLGRKYAC
jgi:hypothetical protein